MRFSTIFFTLASLGAAFAAVEQPNAGAEKLAKREEFRDAIKRSAMPAPGEWGWGDYNFVGTCDHDNDCPRVCRENGFENFSDEGTKCCYNKCSCAGGCNGNGGKNECDADNDCPRVCREVYNVKVDSSGSKCCNTNCNCYGNTCGNGWGSGWGNGWKN
ncbi:hypothetical protein MPH_01777 [Macrophomina phaseolina MS6]|uniref:Uncharacterized protein n=1 Tax=Macrophomina phaseolina (strain MS6) TaxID=1126212 RepID=K2S1L2_MACPH|nr:hypothetical protein MPH_01777 [Macrophomina phaseolina MS6]